MTVLPNELRTTIIMSKIYAAGQIFYFLFFFPQGFDLCEELKWEPGIFQRQNSKSKHDEAMRVNVRDHKLGFLIVATYIYIGRSIYIA